VLLTLSAFQTADLAINPAEVNPGEEVIITAQVTNAGDTEDIYTAELRVNDVTVVTTEVTIAAGASQPISFEGALATPGTYKVTWIELIGETAVPRLTGQFVVNDFGTIEGEPNVLSCCTGNSAITEPEPEVPSCCG